MTALFRHTFKAVAALALVAAATHAFAAAQRTFVASTGSDANPCSLALPCRTFAQAVTSAAAGGEVVVLDTAGYGVVAIDKAITIAGPPGVQASITASTGIGIYVLAGAADRVVLRGLDIITSGSATYGIEILSAADVVIEDCLVSGTATYGVGYAGTGRLTISRSRIQAAPGKTGIGVVGSGGEARFVLEDSRVEVAGSAEAVLIVDTVAGTVRDSKLLGAPGDASYGVRLQGSSGKVPTVSVQRTLVSGHAYAVYVDGQGAAFGANATVLSSELSQSEFAVSAVSGGTVALSGSNIVHSQFGVTATGGGAVFTDGRNFFGYNTQDLNGTTTLAGPVGLR